MMNESKRAQYYYQAKKRHLSQLSILVWHLTGRVDLFTPAMRSALFEIWRNAKRFSITKDPDDLYEIALNACYEIWQQQGIHKSLSQQSSPGSVRSVTVRRPEGWKSIPRDISLGRNKRFNEL